MLGNKSQLKNNMMVSIDWLAFTSTIIRTPLEMIEFLGYKEVDFMLLPKGANGYSKVHRLKGFSISILSEGNENMGIHVVVGGSALTDLLNHYRRTLLTYTPFGYAERREDFNNTVVIELLEDIRRVGWLTRLDIALDDIGERYFSVDDVYKHVLEHEVVSKFRTVRNVVESDLMCNKTGHTLYLGSRQSEVFLRVYDKQLEQNKKIEKDEDKIDYKWVRWELELKDNRANVCADYLISRKSLGVIFTEILNNYFRIIVNDDSNKSRCSINNLWVEFIETVNKLVLFVRDIDKTIEDKRRWIIRSVMPTLSGLIIADGGCLDIVTEHFHDAIDRMSPHMQHLVSQANPGWINAY